MSLRIRTLITIATVACMALFVCVVSTTPAAAQASALSSEAAGFGNLGFIQAATVDIPQNQGIAGDLLAGGTIRVNDHTIIVPANSIVQMPANTLSWAQVFAQTPVASVAGVATDISMGGTRTGMALDDCAPPLGHGVGCLPGTYEALVQGNIVANPAVCGAHLDAGTGLPLTSPCYIAGLIFLSQQSLNTTTGFIDSIDYANGVLVVGGKRVMVNDPPVPGLTNTFTPTNSAFTGRHSLGQSPDTRFTVDQTNPTVRSETGYPMCIPRVAPGSAPHTVTYGTVTVTSTEDDRCPQRNRPLDTTGNFAANFTMAAPRANPLTTQPSGLTDPWEQMPFEVGDSVTYWGAMIPPCAAGTGPGTATFCQPDLSAPASSYIIEAYQVIGNVGAYTFPGTNPVYIGLDVLLQGTGGVPNPTFPQEATSKVKVEGFSTDDSRPVDMLALDQDCNGTLTDRLSAPWALSFTVDPGPPTGAVRGRFRFRPIGGPFLPPVSLVRVRVSGYTGYLSPSTTDNLGVPLASPTIAANGLVYGQYNAPDFAFVFPENLLVGLPIITYNFFDFPELVNGTGPLNGNPAYPVGQLSPWPDLTTPALSCTPGVVPALNANFVATPDGISSPALVGNPVTLNAGASVESGATNFVWTLSPQFKVTCGNFSCSLATFTPTSAGNVNITLTATQVNASGVVIGTATSSFTLNVTKPVQADVVTITNVVYRTTKARLDVNATSSIVQATPSGCTLTNLLPGCMKATLDIINTSTGQPYAALMQNLGNGTYTVTFTGIPAPNLVTVTSGNGGSATSGVTRVR
jgi:hypothetical protein